MSLARWLQDRPVLLEFAYRVSDRLIRALEPVIRIVGRARVEPLFQVSEEVSKGWIFDCRMCGMCTLHNTGMTCPMTCPKEMRNGPCGGVRPDGKCELIPDMDCVWLLAWERSERMPHFGAGIEIIQPPIDRQLQDTSAWLNSLEGRDQFEWADCA